MADMADTRSAQNSESTNLFQWAVLVASIFLYILFLYNRWTELFILIVSLGCYAYAREDGRERTSSQNILVNQLVATGVGRENAIEAAEACSSYESAMYFLNQECHECHSVLSKQKVLSMLRCSHQFCKPCAVKFFTKVLKEGHITECVCPICHCPEVPEEDLEYFSHLGIILNEILDLEHLEKFNKLYQKLLGNASGGAPIEESLTEPAERMWECGLCLNTFNIHEMECLFCCEHMCCITCIREIFAVLVREKSLISCSCPFCDKLDLASDEEFTKSYFATLDIQLQRILDPSLYAMFSQKLRDRTLNSDPLYKWCQKCSYGFYFQPGQKRLTCAQCEFVWCSTCNNEWENQHNNMTCEQFSTWKREKNETEELEQFFKTAEKLICPKCKHPYALDRGGCLHFICTQCKHEFCSGCQEQFFPGKCDRDCRKGLHAHHPRNCLYFLRDYPPGQLQQLLANNSIHFSTEVDGQGETCGIRVRNETTDGCVDALCGLRAPQGYAGLCAIHYVEYLCKIIWDHKIDVSPLSEAPNAEPPPEDSKSITPLLDSLPSFPVN